MKVLIADDQWVSRAGLARLLSLMDQNAEIVESTSFARAAEELAKGGFDICLVDLGLPDMDPLAGLRRLRQAAPAVPLAVVTMKGSRRLALQAIEMGALGYILKSASAEDIRRAIERVMAGEISLPPTLRDMPAETAPVGLSEAPTQFIQDEETGDGGPMSMLTPRQREVLALIATGKRNADIARALDISPRTVQIHVSTILKLLKLGNRTEAALLARKYMKG